MAIHVIISLDQNGNVATEMTHKDAVKLYAGDGGHLSVSSEDQLIAIYSPGNWVAATIVEADEAK